MKGNLDFNSYLISILDNADSIIDIGARQGSFKYSVDKKVLFLDNDINYFPQTEKNKFIYADSYNLPVQKNSFDIAVLKYILEHTVKPELIIKNTYNVLKQKGYMIISVPNAYSFQEVLYKTLGFIAQVTGKGKQAHIQNFNFKKICDLCYKHGLILFSYKLYDSGLSFLDKNIYRRKFKIFLNAVIAFLRKYFGLNILKNGEMYFIFKKL